MDNLHMQTVQVIRLSNTWSVSEPEVSSCGDPEQTEYASHAPLISLRCNVN